MKIDPATGKPAEGEPTEPKDENNPKIAVPAEEWGAMKARLDAFEKGAYNQAPAQSAPAQPSGPTHTEQIREIESKIDALDKQIDAQIEDGKPVSKLMKDRSAYERKITRLQIKHEDIDPVFSAGMQSIDQLSSEVSKGKMKYFDIVQKDYESLLNTLAPDQRTSLEVRQKIYDIAVGQNVDKIMDAQKEEILRKEHDNTQNPPNGKNRNPGDDDIPKPKDILPEGALTAIRSLGMTTDEYYKKRGYSGWKGYYEKHKEYYQDKESVE